MVNPSIYVESAISNNLCECVNSSIASIHKLLANYLWAACMVTSFRWILLFIKLRDLSFVVFELGLTFNYDEMFTMPLEGLGIRLSKMSRNLQ